MGLFSFNKNKKPQQTINWFILKDVQQLEELKKESHQKPVVFFKHSTRCSISSMALNRLESNWQPNTDHVLPVYLDLIAYRNISNQLAEDFEVIHQSPQVLVVKNGKCVYNASHNQIDVELIKAQL